MAAANRSKYLAWALLALCVLSVPIGLLSKSGRSLEKGLKGESDEKWISILTNRDRILVLRLTGMIYDDEDSDGFLPSSSAGHLLRKLKKAAKNDHIKAVLLRINSPGGTVAMSQEIYAALQAVRNAHKPVIVSMGDVAASGGYYIASACDRVFADPGTLTGSIGVIMHLMNWQETEKKIGLKPDVIKSGVFKDIGSSDRPMTEEERNLLSGIIMDSYDQFVSAVAQGRNLDKDVVRKLADGRVYSGRQALKVKLIDELGGYADALAYLQKSCRIKLRLNKDLPVDDEASLGFLANILQGSSSSSRISVKDSLLKGILPQSMDSTFDKQPLWIMQ